MDRDTNARARSVYLSSNTLTDASDNSCANNAFFISVTVLAWIRMLLRKAPQPFCAVYITFKHGLYKIAIFISLSTASAIEMQTKSNLRTKFIVPSIGSIIQVGVMVRTCFASVTEALSSAINLKIY